MVWRPWSLVVWGPAVVVLAAVGCAAGNRQGPEAPPAPPSRQEAKAHERATTCFDTSPTPGQPPVRDGGPAACPGRGIGGRVVDRITGAPLAGVTVVLASEALRGTPAELTDAEGRYVRCGLPPGEYSLTFYYADLTVRRPRILATGEHLVEVDALVDRASPGETTARAPSVDSVMGDFGPQPGTGRVLPLRGGYTEDIPTPSCADD